MGPRRERRQSLPPAGAVIAGRYELVRRLAEGGMGAVYEARDGENKVALKLLRPELTSDADVRRRFRRESSILRALEHSAVVRILDVGEENESLLFMVMELLDGETLAERLGRVGVLAPSAALPIVRGICAGLGAAHEHGIIHGDLKPANVFLLAGDSVKLLDFGLSKVLGLERLTRTGEVIGTPAYMAPELLTGKGELDERIDTYALGVILYQILAGKPPFAGSIPGKLMMDIVMGELRPLPDTVSSAVAAVVTRAMSRVREARFASAAELSAAFELACA